MSSHMKLEAFQFWNVQNINLGEIQLHDRSFI